MFTFVHLKTGKLISQREEREKEKERKKEKEGEAKWHFLLQQTKSVGKEGLLLPVVDKDTRTMSQITMVQGIRAYYYWQRKKSTNVCTGSIASEDKET